MQEDRNKLLVYAPSDRETANKIANIKKLAGKSGIYSGGVEVLTHFSLLPDLLANGLPQIARIIALYNKSGLAISFLNEVCLSLSDWTASGAMAITGIPTGKLCDTIRVKMVPERVWVFGVGAGYLPGINLSAFIAGGLFRQLKDKDWPGSEEF